MDISTNSLRTFIAVCECKSFSLAAVRVYKSQAAISAQIAKLEEEAGLKLIDRSQRSFTLTAGGRLFLKSAKEILARIEEGDRALQELRREAQGDVRIGATRSVATYILPEIIRNIAKDFPKLRLLLLTQPATRTYERLRQGEVDLALVLADRAPKGLVAKFLRCEPLCFIISSKHCLATRKIISPKELDQIPFVLGTKGNEYSDMVDRILERSGIPKPTGGFAVDDLQARKEAALAGVGAAILPRFAVQDEIRDGTLTMLTIRGVRLADARLMILERRRSINPSIQLLKKLLEEKLADRDLDQV